MSTLKYNPRRGVLTLFEDLSQSALELAGATTAGGLTYYSNIVEIDALSDADTATPKLVIRKRNFPVEGDATGCGISFQLQGRYNEQDYWRSVGSAVTITDLALSEGDIGDQNDARSFYEAEIALYPQMRMAVSGFTNAGDAEAALARPWPKYDQSNSSGLINYCPIGATQAAQESAHLILPPQGPIRARSGVGKKYPVVVVARSLGVGTFYNNNFPDSLPWGDDSSAPIMEALNRGYAILYLNTVGVNTDINGGGVEGYWKTSPNYSGSTSVRDARVDMQWAIQWVRTIGKDLYDLDPNRVILHGGGDSASSALLSAYGLSEPRDTSASVLQRRAKGRPDFVSLQNPEFVWTIMGPSLRCPLRNPASPGNSADTIGNAFTLSPLDLGDMVNFDLCVMMTLRNMTVAHRMAIASIPYYCMATINDVGSVGTDVVLSDGSTSFSTVTTPAASTVLTQRSPAHSLILQLVRESFARNIQSGTDFESVSRLNVTAATTSYSAGNLALVDSNITSTTDSFVDMIERASHFLGFAPEVITGACFDAEIVV